jgi:hypothetical protein
MKVALLLCPSWDADHPVVSLALLSAALKRRGHEVQILDLNHRMSRLGSLLTPDLPRHVSPADPWTDPLIVENTILPAYSGWLEQIVESLSAGGVRLVGFSTYCSNQEMSLAVARLLKRRVPDIVTVFGGPSCFTVGECVDLLKRDCVDVAVLGEADLSFPRLVDAVERTGRPQASPGVLLRDDPSTWKEGAELIEDLDELPFADYEAFGALGAYTGKIIHTTRGCVRKCVYCSDWREMSFRHMSGRRVFDEVAHQLARHPDVKHFMFGDSVSNGSMKDLGAFCDLVIAHALPITWHGYAIVRPEMTPAFLAKMRAAGCRGLYYGVESGSWRVLQRMRKPVPPALNARVLKDTKAAGIEPIVLWMVGFPTETEETFQESVDFVTSNVDGIGRLYPSLFSIHTMHDLKDEYGLDGADSDLFWRTRDGQNTFPVRLGRLRRLMESATTRGVRISYQGALELPALAEYEARVMRLYDSARPR